MNPEKYKDFGALCNDELYCALSENEESGTGESSHWLDQADDVFQRLAKKWNVPERHVKRWNRLQQSTLSSYFKKDLDQGGRPGRGIVALMKLCIRIGNED